MSALLKLNEMRSVIKNGGIFNKGRLFNKGEQMEGFGEKVAQGAFADVFVVTDPVSGKRIFCKKFR